MSEVKTGSSKVEGAEKFSTLKRKSVRGGLVALSSQGFTIAIQLVSTVILARLLTPEDYGTLAMVTAVTAFAAMFRDLGLSAAAIQKKGLTAEQQSNLFWLNVLMGGFVAVLVAACAPFIARFYDKPELVGVTLVLSLNFIIVSMGAQHDALLVRRMQFGRISSARIAGAASSLVVSVVCALKGYAYWSLVWGTMTGGAISTLLLFVLSPFRPGLPCRGSGVRALVGFGANVTAFNFVNYFSRNLDKILIGKFVGADALGIYGRAYQLLVFPLLTLQGPINSVAFPAMSQLDSKSSDFRSYYCDVISILALLTMPLTAWMFISAEEIIILFLGVEWRPVIPFFSVLAIVGFIQPVAGMRGLILLSSGQSKRYLHQGLVCAIITTIAFILGISYGAIGIAWAYALTEWFLLVPLQLYAMKGTSIRFLDFVSSIRIPFLSSAFSIIIISQFDFEYGIRSLALKGVIVAAIGVVGALFSPVLRLRLFELLSRGESEGV